MTLKELKKMVAEEYAAYKKSLKEQGPAGPMTDIPDPTIALSGDDVDTEGGGAEDILKDIYDRLKAHFEGEDDTEDDAGDDAEDDAGEDVEGEEDKEADLEEKASTGYGDTGAKKSSGTNGAYTKKVSVKEQKRNQKNKEGLRKRIIAESRMKKRFKTLANIKK